MLNIVYNTYSKDISEQPLEVVERKGVGHPDSLADALANEVSNTYSKYCLDNFGVILHHNVDKLYIGAGHYKNDYGFVQKISPVQVRINGRMSNSFEGKEIPIDYIQKKAVTNYLQKVLPNFSEDDFLIKTNSTQNTKIPFWFTPRGIQDLPESSDTKANDTSFCVSHYPLTPTECIAYELEHYFWTAKNNYPIAKFPEIGQDIKVMVVRVNNSIEATLCVPTISSLTNNYKHYQQIINHHESTLQKFAASIAKKYNLLINVKVNPHQKQYMLGKGSCIECGEEGVVGRGNNINGIISSYRTNTLESWAGKNPVYHTGRVYGYMTLIIAKTIAQELNIRCSVASITKCGDALFPPYKLIITTSTQVNQNKVSQIITNLLKNTDYISEIISFRP